MVSDRKAGGSAKHREISRKEASLTPSPQGRNPALAEKSSCFQITLFSEETPQKIPQETHIQRLRGI